jgi:hypothetical protein
LTVEVVIGLLSGIAVIGSIIPIIVKYTAARRSSLKIEIRRGSRKVTLQTTDINEAERWLSIWAADKPPPPNVTLTDWAEVWGSESYRAQAKAAEELWRMRSHDETELPPSNETAEGDEAE